MLKEQKDKRHRAKYPARIFGALILSIFIIALIAHLWLVPTKVSREIERALLKFWDEQVDIEDIDINYFAPICLAKVSFSDKTGREYIHTGKVKMVFKKWPGLHPVVTEVEIEKLCLHVVF